MAYVVIRDWTGYEQYWTGSDRRCGYPSVSRDIAQAVHFHTARAAYEAATEAMESCPRIGRFKVGKRSIT